MSGLTKLGMEIIPCWTTTSMYNNKYVFLRIVLRSRCTFVPRASVLWRLQPVFTKATNTYSLSWASRPNVSVAGRVSHFSCRHLLQHLFIILYLPPLYLRSRFVSPLHISYYRRKCRQLEFSRHRLFQAHDVLALTVAQFKASFTVSLKTLLYHLKGLSPVYRAGRRRFFRAREREAKIRARKREQKRARKKRKRRARKKKSANSRFFLNPKWKSGF